MTDTEKITINLGAIDLGKVDLLVEQGHYSNRTDFIRSAIHSQLDKHVVEVQQAIPVTHSGWVLFSTASRILSVTNLKVRRSR